MRPNQQKPPGFSVLEIIIVIGISSLLLTALLRFVVIGYPISKTTYLQARSTEVARLQLKRLAKNLRELRPADTGAYPLVETSAQRIVFYSNIDNDPATEKVRFELNGTNFIRGVTDPSGDPLSYSEDNEVESVVVSSIRNASNPIFTYYTGDYPANQTALTPTDLTEVKYIQFHLNIDIDPDAPPPAVDVNSQVQLRNLKTNLGEVVE